MESCNQLLSEEVASSKHLTPPARSQWFATNGEPKVGGIIIPDDAMIDGCTKVSLVTIQPRDQATSSINYQNSLHNDPEKRSYRSQEVFTEECYQSGQVLILSAYSSDDTVRAFMSRCVNLSHRPRPLKGGDPSGISLIQSNHTVYSVWQALYLPIRAEEGKCAGGIGDPCTIHTCFDKLNSWDINYKL